MTTSLIFSANDVLLAQLNSACVIQENNKQAHQSDLSKSHEAVETLEKSLNKERENTAKLRAEHDTNIEAIQRAHEMELEELRETLNARIVETETSSKRTQSQQEEVWRDKTDTWLNELKAVEDREARAAGT